METLAARTALADRIVALAAAYAEGTLDSGELGERAARIAIDAIGGAR